MSGEQQQQHKDRGGPNEAAQVSEGCFLSDSLAAQLIQDSTVHDRIVAVVLVAEEFLAVAFLAVIFLDGH